MNFTTMSLQNFLYPLKAFLKVNVFRLSHLNIGYSNISALPCLTDNVFPNLTELNLIENNISRFEDVLGLAHTFPNLHTLVLSDNPLSSFGEDQQVVVYSGKTVPCSAYLIQVNSSFINMPLINWRYFQ